MKITNILFGVIVVMSWCGVVRPVYGTNLRVKWNDTEHGQDDDVQDIPRYDVVELKDSVEDGLEMMNMTMVGDMVGDKKEGNGKGRTHCYRSDLYCANGGRCCTHVHRKQVWCCDRESECGRVPHTCRRRRKKKPTM